jgi:hypothetical protein
MRREAEKTESIYGKRYSYLNSILDELAREGRIRIHGNFMPLDKGYELKTRVKRWHWQYWREIISIKRFLE